MTNLDWSFRTLPFGIIWTQGTLRHILEPLVIFEVCHFMAILGLFEYFPEKGCSQNIKIKGQHLYIRI